MSDHAPADVFSDAEIDTFRAEDYAAGKAVVTLWAIRCGLS